MRRLDYCCIVRLETRAREFFVVVRLKGFYPCSRRETDMPAALLRGKVLIGPGITALKPEAGRSIPEQDEVALTSDGGSQGCCSAKHSFDLGIVVKGQSRPATAGSTRNDSKVSLTGGWWRGRALIGRLGRETSRRTVKLRTRHRRRRLE